MPSFPILKPLPGSKKSFASVSARVNSFGDRKAVSKLPAPGASAAAEKPLNANPLKNASRADGDVDVKSPPGDFVRQPFRAKPLPVSTYQPPKDRSTVKKDTQKPAKKDAAKSPLSEKVKPVPFRARPVPASTYNKPSFQPTVRIINVAVIEKEQAPVEVVDEPIIADDVEVAEPIHEPASCEPPKVDEPNGINEDVCCPTGSVDEPAEASIVIEGARALLPPHPQGPDIPPFLPMVFIKDCIRPYAPQQWDNYTGPPDYGNLHDANGTYFWDRSMANYHCIRMPQECFYQHFPEHRVGDGAMPQSDVQGNGDQPANARVRNGRKKKPHKAEWNASYQRRLARRAKERAERATREQQEAPTEVSENTDSTNVSEKADGNLDASVVVDQISVSIEEVGLPEPTCDPVLEEHLPIYAQQESVVVSSVQGKRLVDGTAEVVADGRGRGKKKPHKALWNKSYQRRLARRAKERAERAAMEAQKEAAEAAVPQVPQ